MSADDKKNENKSDAQPADATETAEEVKAAASGSVPETALDDGATRPEGKDRATEDAIVDAVPDESAAAASSVQGRPPRADGFARFVAVVALLVAVAVLALSQFPQVPQGSAFKLAEIQGRLADIGTPQPVVADETLRTDLDQVRTSLSAAEERLANLSLLLDEMRTEQAKLASAGEAGSGDLSAVETRMSDLSAKVDELEARPVPDVAAAQVVQPAVQSAAPELDAELAALSTEVAGLKSELARIVSAQGDISDAIGAGDARVRDELRTAIDTTASALTAQVDSVAAAARQTSEVESSQLAGKAALVLAAGRLKDAAAGSAPFDGAWQAVAALGVDAAAYPAITSASVSGTPTLAELKSGFSDAASRAIVADKVGDGGGWVDGALKRVGSLVKVRRTGDLEGDAVESIVARAEVRMNNDNLADALTELVALQGAAAKDMAGWIAQGKKRLALDNAVDDLQASLLSGLAGSN